jgi:hypothetical protein
MNQPEGIEPFFEPLESLQRLLSRFDDRGVIIGGVAVSVLGKARYTEDHASKSGSNNLGMYWKRQTCGMKLNC